jgi:hypothetical protein
LQLKRWDPAGQTRIDEALKKTIAPKRRKKAS